MTNQIRRYVIAAGLALVAATMAFAQHLDLGDPEPSQVRQAAYDRKAPIKAGDRLDPAGVHQVSRPGLYGVSNPPSGSSYGVIDGRLIRFDNQTLQVQSIIRPVDNVLD